MLWCAWMYMVGSNSRADGQDSMIPRKIKGDCSLIIHCMHACTLAMIR